MAKKKQTHQQKSPKLVEEQVAPQNAGTTPAMEDNTAEKLSNLKSLNTMLVNETAKNRQEITALLDDKKSLEAELTQSESEVESLRSELSRVSEELRNVGVEKEGLRIGKEEIETELTRSDSEVESLRSELTRVREELKSVKVEKEELRREKEDVERKKCVVDFEIEKLKELENELRGEIESGMESVNITLRDKNELELGLKAKGEEVKELRWRLSEFEVKDRNVMKALEGLRVEYEVVVKALKESESRVTGMQFQCDELKKEVEDLSGEKEVVSRENEGLRKLKLELERQISNLGKEACGLNDVVLSLKEDIEKWRVRFSELEKSNVEVVMELDWLKSEFGALVEEKKAKEREIDGLIGEKLNSLERLGVLEKEIEDLKRVNEEVIEEKNMLDAVKSSQEDKIRELQSEVNEIRENLLSIQESNKDQLENNTKLLSEINDHKSALDRAVKERDDVKSGLDEEKMNGVKLQLKVSEISKKMEETAKVIEDLKGASDTVVTEKKELEIKYNRLADEKGLIEKNYFKANKKIGKLENSLKLKSGMLESNLVMLRNTAMQLSVGNKKGADEGMTVNERGIDGEMTHYVTELELIRSAFKSREEKAGEMEKQMEKLHLCVLDAKKKKSFWTLVSSATTIFAVVVSFAYAKRFR